MKTILVPVDLSEASAAVVEAATPLARAFQARVALLYVVRPVMVTNEYAAYVEILDARRDPDAERILGDFKAELARAGIEAEIKQVSGSPIYSILDEAEKVAADYIVMGSHGHGTLYGLLVGSTTAGVLKRARQPVLIVGRNEIQSVASASPISDQAAKV